MRPAPSDDLTYLIQGPLVRICREAHRTSRPSGRPSASVHAAGALWATWRTDGSSPVG